MLVLVTGGHGFVGSHLVRRLLQEGDRVRCLVRKPGTPASLSGLEVDCRVGDVTRPETLEKAVEGVDEVYHLAAKLTASSEAEMLRTNASGTRHLVEAAARTGRVNRFVHCSSLAVVGPSPLSGSLAEGAPWAPVTWYGASKALAERIVRSVAPARSLPYTIVRPPVVYGPNDRGLLSVFRAVAGGVRPLLGAQPKRYSWIYGPDLADALVTLGRHEATKGKTYFAAHETPATMEVFLDLVAKAVGRPGRAVRAPDSLLRLAASLLDVAAQATGKPGMLTRDKVNELVPRAWVCCTDAASRDVGWRATTPLEVGIPATVRWYGEQGWIRAPRAALEAGAAAR